MTTTIGMELLPVIRQIFKILNRCSPVQQQQVLEMLVAIHTQRCVPMTDFVLSSMFKHIAQLNGQRREFEETVRDDAG